jgi:hypothetical protein
VNDAQVAAAVVLTVLTLVVVFARQVVGLRDDRAVPRWLDLVAAVLVFAFLVAMAMRLRTAL